MCHPMAIAGGAGDDSRPVERVTIQCGNEQMPAYISEPEGAGPHPAVVIICDIFGAGPFYQDLAGRLAYQGYLALLPDIFHRLGELPEQTMDAARARNTKLSDERAIDDLGKAIEYLQQRSDVAPKQIGLMGFCLGGTLTILMAARNEAVGAGCIYYGFPVNRNLTANKPFSPVDEVPNIKAPLIGFWGDQDTGVGMDNVRRFEQEMQRYNKAGEIHIYPGAGHGFLARRSEPDMQAANDSWPKMLGFFDKHLRVKAPA